MIARTGLRSINFRQNLIANASALSTSCAKGAMEDLELRDNHLSVVGCAWGRGKGREGAGTLAWRGECRQALPCRHSPTICEKARLPVTFTPRLPDSL